MFRFFTPGEIFPENEFPEAVFDETEWTDLHSHVRHEKVRFELAFGLLKRGQQVMSRLDHRLFRIELAIYTLVVAAMLALFGIDEILARLIGG